MLPRQSLITIYTSFIWPRLDYANIIYDQPNSEGFCNLIERFQYNAVLAIIGANKGTSQRKIYNELGIESLKFLEDVSGDCVCFIKSKLPKRLSICMNYFPQNHILAILVA